MTPDEFTIIERNLTRALVSGDYDLYRSLVHLPITIVPRGGEVHEIRTDAELREDFDLYVRALAAQRVSDIYRRVLGMSQMEEDWVEVTVETHLLGLSGRLVDPFHTQFVLRPYDGIWRIVLIRSSFGHLRWARGLARITDQGRFEDFHEGDRSLTGRPLTPNEDGDRND
ncbi:MAG: hypothetical protein CML66_18875 [Rhodobacteraceae bacterium]|nr:hypothetical protein [Paracoccaceae bacterium]MAY45514.1 hypothetical protein [Paracoccaceae bacterium]QEW21590.1 hypothetical protein LA6_003802 [Marinibacterium anthonyi]